MAELRRLYAPPEAFSADGLLLEGERLRHVRTVLRLGPGDELTATDGAGGEYRLRVARLGRDSGLAAVLERSEPSRESPLRTVLAQALPRAERFAFVLEKAVELGVSGVVPVISGRATAGGAGATARWRRIVEAALAQSGRTRLPTLYPPCRWEQLVGDAALPPLRLLLWERAHIGLREILEGCGAPPGVLVAVGPEGGWTGEEVALGERAGFLPARLGPRTLRTETAGLAALAILQHRWGDAG